MGLLARWGSSRNGSEIQISAVLQASIAPPLERVWSKLEKSVAGVHPDREDVDTALEEDPALFPRSCLQTHLRAQNHLVSLGGDLAH